ncbi:MAG: biotin--[Alphaproteobacteria bacterium]|nr:biotin--[acetyl-CoA-carboxylase] ligase [Alphaproteobacteria bacterium]
MLSTYKEITEGYNLYDLEEITSTNDVLKSLKNLNQKTVIMAKTQTKGRGRRENIWSSPIGNLYFSYNENIKLNDLSKIVYIVGLSLAKTIKGLSKTYDVKIKWPNDVMINNKKVSGILIENIKDDVWCIGIGVNIVSSPTLKNASYQATSLKESGIILDRKEFLSYYLKNYQITYKEYQEKGFNMIKNQWLELALNLNKKIIVKTEKETKEGIFTNIDDNGYMIITQNNIEERIIAGELFI